MKIANEAVQKIDVKILSNYLTTAKIWNYNKNRTYSPVLNGCISPKETFNKSIMHS